MGSLSDARESLAQGFFLRTQDVGLHEMSSSMSCISGIDRSGGCSFNLEFVSTYPASYGGCCFVEGSLSKVPEARSRMTGWAGHIVSLVKRDLQYPGLCGQSPDVPNCWEHLVALVMIVEFPAAGMRTLLHHSLLNSS